MLNPFKNFMSKQTQTISTTGYSPFMLNGTLLSTNTVDADGALQNSDIYAVINRIAGDVASCEFKTDQYSNMLNQPSTLLSAYNFWQAVSAQMMRLCSNSAKWQWKSSRVDLNPVLPGQHYFR